MRLRNSGVRRYAVSMSSAQASPSQLIHLHAHILQEGDEIVDIQDIGHIVDGYFLPCEQYGAEYLQHLVLGTLRADFS